VTPAPTTVNYANTADGRALGFFQLSIATSLAIESAVGIHPDLPRPESMPIRQYKELWVNLRTLYRNIVGAMPKDIAAQIHAVEIAQIMVEEMHILPDMLREYAGHPVKVVYYFNNLNKLESKYPEALLRKDNTPRQQQYTQTLGDVIKIMLADVKDLFMVVNDSLPGHAVNALIITHVVYDLLSDKNFGNLMLLESHTGRIKPKALWYTKYYQGRELSMIPFTEELLQVFGDLDTFHPLDVNLRKAIIELATHRRWSSVTTRARIVDGISELKNPAHILKLKKLYKVLV
jgi:hypothetical protein